ALRVNPIPSGLIVKLIMTSPVSAKRTSERTALRARNSERASFAKTAQLSRGRLRAVGARAGSGERDTAVAKAHLLRIVGREHQQPALALVGNQPRDHGRPLDIEVRGRLVEQQDP